MLVFTIKLSTTCINQCNIRDKLALVICNILIYCNLNMALHLNKTEILYFYKRQPSNNVSITKYTQGYGCKNESVYD